LVLTGAPGAAALGRWQRWRAQAPFNDERWWRARWEQAGIDPDTLERLLDPAIPDTDPPAWFSAFQSCYAADAAFKRPAWLKVPSLLEAVLPLLNWAVATLRSVAALTPPGRWNLPGSGCSTR
jgi:hypothetical protein